MLVLFVLALRATASVSSSLDLDEDFKERPVSKVIKLLKDMQTQLTKEGEEDKSVYEKVQCWCETNGGDKLKTIEDAEASISDSTSTIEALTAKSAQLSTDIQDLEAEIADNQDALGTATSLREKALEEFTSEEKDLLQSVQALKDAVVVLGKHHAAPEEELLSIAALIKHQMHVHGKMLRHAAIDDGMQNKVVSMLQGEYAPQSGEIFGILNQMKETFEQNLSLSQKQELSEQQAFEELKTAKSAEIDAGETQLAAKRTLLAETDEKCAQAKQNLEDTQNNLSADQKFLLELKQRCQVNDSEWAERQQARQTEIAAVGEALTILASDDSHDMFAKTLGFVQVAQTSDADIRRKAAAVLAGQPRLAAIATSVKLDAFEKVKAAIDEMVTNLLREKEDEIKHKDFCTGEFNQNEREQQLKGRDLDSLNAHIEDLGATADDLVDQLATLASEIEEMQTQMKRAGEDRSTQNTDFQLTVSDQRAAQEVLAKALGVMKAVYASASLVQVKKATQEPAGPPPPAGFKEYKQAGGGTGVVGMLEQIIADAARMEKDAITAEKDSQSAYESFVKETNLSMETKQRDTVNKSANKAETDVARTQAVEDQKTATADLQRMKNEESDLHKSCDFVTENFDIRQTARDQEVEALRQAKAILSGSNFSFLAKRA